MIHTTAKVFIVLLVLLFQTTHTAPVGQDSQSSNKEFRSNNHAEPSEIQTAKSQDTLDTSKQNDCLVNCEQSTHTIEYMKDTDIEISSYHHDNYDKVLEDEHFTVQSNAHSSESHVTDSTENNNNHKIRESKEENNNKDSESPEHIYKDKEPGSSYNNVSGSDVIDNSTDEFHNGNSKTSDIVSVSNFFGLGQSKKINVEDGQSWSNHIDYINNNLDKSRPIPTMGDGGNSKDITTHDIGMVGRGEIINDITQIIGPVDISIHKRKDEIPTDDSGTGFVDVDVIPSVHHHNNNDSSRPNPRSGNFSIVNGSNPDGSLMVYGITNDHQSPSPSPATTTEYVTTHGTIEHTDHADSSTHQVTSEIDQIRHENYSIVYNVFNVTSLPPSSSSSTLSSLRPPDATLPINSSRSSENIAYQSSDNGQITTITSKPDPQASYQSTNGIGLNETPTSLSLLPTIHNNELGKITDKSVVLTSSSTTQNPVASSHSNVLVSMNPVVGNISSLSGGNYSTNTSGITTSGITQNVNVTTLPDQFNVSTSELTTPMDISTRNDPSLSTAYSVNTLTTNQPTHIRGEIPKSTETITPIVTTTEKPHHAFVELKMSMSWSDFCDIRVDFRGELVWIVQGKRSFNRITADQIQLINVKDRQCVDMEILDSDEINVQLYILNKDNQYDGNLTKAFAYFLKTGLTKSGFEHSETTIIKDKLIDVQYHYKHLVNHEPGVDSVENEEKEMEREEEELLSDPGAAVVISLAVIGGACCVAILFIQYFWRKKHHATARLTNHSTSSKIVYTTKTNRSFSLNSVDSVQLYSVSNKSSRRNSGIINLGLNLLDPLDPTHPLNIDQLYEFYNNETRIQREFEKLPNRLPRLSVVPLGDEDKNRYANVLPLPHTRVKLVQDGVQSNQSSYINASYVTGHNNECQYYIATQAPTSKTTGDFWTMVWQQKSTIIIMLTQLEENGQAKSVAYWPDITGKGAAQRHGDFHVELKQKDVHQEYIVSKLEVNNLRRIENRTVYHYWYTCWPTQGTPEPISLVKFVLDTRPKYESGKVPVVVHCSPGTGRTCTFIGLDLCMRQFENHRVVDVLKTVNDMRYERAGAIQNKEQYKLLYRAIFEYARIVVSPAVSAASSATTLHALLPG